MSDFLEQGDRMVEPQLHAASEMNLENSLRPQTFDGFIGQKALKDNLSVYIEAADRKSVV